MRKIAIIEARMTSSRLPGKVLMETCGKPMLQHMIERVKRSRRLDDVVLATTINHEDNPVVSLCEKIGCNYYRGSEEDVLLRVVEAARKYKGDLIIELTGDCPLIDWRHIDYLIDVYEKNDYDFVSNCTERSFPDGFDIRIFSRQALEKVEKYSNDPIDREHVAVYFPNHPDEYRNYNWNAQREQNRPDIEVTLDEEGDYQLIDAVFSGLYYSNSDFSCTDVIDFLDSHKEFFEYTKDIKRKII